MRLTRHATRRLRQRAGLNKKSLDYMTQRAYDLGLRRRETTGRLRRYMDALKYGRGNTTIRLYANFVWVFGDEALITVYPIPAEYQVGAARAIRRKRDEGANY